MHILAAQLHLKKHYLKQHERYMSSNNKLHVNLFFVCKMKVLPSSGRRHTLQYDYPSEKLKCIKQATVCAAVWLYCRIPVGFYHFVDCPPNSFKARLNYCNTSLYDAIQFNSIQTAASKMIVQLNQHLSRTVSTKTEHFNLHHHLNLDFYYKF